MTCYLTSTDLNVMLRQGGGFRGLNLGSPAQSDHQISQVTSDLLCMVTFTQHEFLYFHIECAATKEKTQL